MDDSIENDMPSEDCSNEEIENKEETYKPLISGILLLIAGILAIMNFSILISANEMILSSYNTTFSQAGMNITASEVSTFLMICGTIGIIISIFPILSSLLCFKRKLWGFALGSAIIGIFSMGPMFASTVLCIVSVILIAQSKKEFE